jgi:hypothetical protein
VVLLLLPLDPEAAAAEGGGRSGAFGREAFASVRRSRIRFVKSAPICDHPDSGLPRPAMAVATGSGEARV